MDRFSNERGFGHEDIDEDVIRSVEGGLLLNLASKYAMR